MLGMHLKQSGFTYSVLLFPNGGETSGLVYTDSWYIFTRIKELKVQKKLQNVKNLIKSKRTQTEPKSLSSLM